MTEEQAQALHAQRTAEDERIGAMEIRYVDANAKAFIERRDFYPLDDYNGMHPSIVAAHGEFGRDSFRRYALKGAR